MQLRAVVVDVHRSTFAPAAVTDCFTPKVMTIYGKGKPFLLCIFLKEKEELRKYTEDSTWFTRYVEIRTNMSYWYDINFDTSSDYRVLMRLPMFVIH